MKRIHFYQLGPTCYKIALEKEIIKRHLINFFSSKKIAREKQDELLPIIVKSHTSLLLRELHGVDMSLQKSKITNIELASQKINKLIVKPSETFSFWQTVGKPTRKKGYQDGLIIIKNGFSKGVGGGLCQMANMIHWLVLNSPLEVTELHHHGDALFPDHHRKVPFGSGTSICYNNVDYCFKNNTDQLIQIVVWVENNELCGELRSDKAFANRYKLVETNHHYRLENNEYYRISKVYKQTINKDTNEVIKEELVLDNHSKVMYDYSLIPKEEIRNE